jgi:regulator of sirC expression with transglutaminase-like and TPR domain
MKRKILLILLFSLLLANFAFSQQKYSGQTIEEILELPEEKINLAIAKLVIDKMVDPSIDINRYLSKLDSMTFDIKVILGPRTKSMDKMLAIKTYLFDAGGWNNNQPYIYDLDDPLGRKIENKLLPNFIESKKGNCVSMPFLFLILGKKMEIDVVASTAPLHIFVRFKDDLTGDVWNVETTNGGNPARNVWYVQQFGISEDAIRNGVFLKNLTNKETISLMLMEVEQYYIERKEYEKALEICDLALKYYPNYAYALARKGNAYACILDRDVRQKGYSPDNPLPKDKEDYYKNIFKLNMECFEKAESLGWKETGKDFDEKYLQMVKEEQNKMKGN